MSFAYIPVNGKPGDVPTKGIIPLYLVTRSLIRYRFRIRHRTITWKKLLQGQWAYATSMGAYICVGYRGWVLC